MRNSLYIIAALLAIAAMKMSAMAQPVVNGNTIYGAFGAPDLRMYYTCHTGLSSDSRARYPPYTEETGDTYQRAATYFFDNALGRRFNRPRNFRLSDHQEMMVETRPPPEGQPSSSIPVDQVPAVRVLLNWNFGEITGALSRMPVDHACCLFQQDITGQGAWLGTLASTMAGSFPQNMVCPVQVITPPPDESTQQPIQDECDPPPLYPPGNDPPPLYPLGDDPPQPDNLRAGRENDPPEQPPSYQASDNRPQLLPLPPIPAAPVAGQRGERASLPARARAALARARAAAARRIQRGRQQRSQPGRDAT